MNQPYTMSNEEQDRLSKKIVQKLNDKDLNHTLCAFEKEMKKNTSENEFAYIDVLKIVSYEMRNSCYFENFIKKAQRGLYITSNGGSLDENEKLSLAELGIMKKLKKLKYCMDRFEEKKVNINLDEKYKKLKNQCQKIESIERQINSLHNPALYTSGDVLVTDIAKTISYKLNHIQSRGYNRENLFNISKKLVTKYGHAAQLTKVGHTIKQSHMWDSRKLDPFTIEDVLEADIFSINISKLVDKSLEASMEKALGETWREKLQILYANKIDVVANDEILNEIKIIGGLRSLDSLLPHWVGRKKNENYGLFSESNNAKKELVKNKMICSDFVAREIVEAIKLVNQELSNVNLTNPIKSPFSNKVNLNRVHPQELIVLLEKEGCLEKITPTKLNILINTKKNFNWLSDRHVELSAELYEKVYSLAKKRLSRDEFTKEAKIAFIGYLDANDTLSLADYNNKKNEIDEYLDIELPKLHERYDASHTGGFIAVFFEFLIDLAHFLGIKNNKKQQIITQTIERLRQKYSPVKTDENNDSDRNSMGS